MKGVADRSLYRPIATASQVVLAIGLIVAGSPLTALAQGYIPPDRGLPGRREGGGTRGDCLIGGQPLVALVPASNLTVTVSERPTLYWYMPQTTAQTAEFRLMDSNDNEIYMYSFPLRGQSGIIALTLPPEMPALEVGKEYRWDMALVCDPRDLSGNVLTDGWIRRMEVSPELSRQLATVPEGDRYQVYRNAGIWQDALMSLAVQRMAQATDAALVRRWSELLGTVGLRQLASAPLINCCQPTQPTASR